MVPTGIGLCYLGLAAWYAASPKTDGLLADVALRYTSRRSLRGLGTVLLLASMGLLVAGITVEQGLLVWLCAAMTAASVFVVAEPLLPQFGLVSSVLVLILLPLLPWL